MDEAFEEHTKQVASEMMSWMSGVVWNVWDWRARWDTARGAAYYAALDAENAQERYEDQRLPEEKRIKCSHCAGEIIAVTPIKLDDVPL
jgi:hypothetical protein